MEIRPEQPTDAEPIRRITTAAFALAEHSSGSEAAIVDALRASNALTLSLVAILDDELVGHIAISPIHIDGHDKNWFGLGPISVRPSHQRQGIGQSLVRQALELLNQSGADGCVVLGDPAFYKRFGFDNHPALLYPGLPPAYFLALPIHGPTPSGIVTYHAAFEIQ